MTIFTTISNALVAVGAKPFATTIQALRDNLFAAFEGDATAVAAGVTLKDAALDAAAATAAGIGWAGLRIAGLAVGAVGSYALLTNQSTAAATVFAGTAIAGSGLRYSSAAGVSSGTLAGTWRSMGHHQTDALATIPTASNQRVTLFLRIS